MMPFNYFIISLSVTKMAAKITYKINIIDHHTLLSLWRFQKKDNPFKKCLPQHNVIYIVQNLQE